MDSKATMVKRIAVSCDEHGPLVDALLRALKDRGFDPVYYGPSAGEEAMDWPVVTQSAVHEVQKGAAGEAIVMCWTGTGCTIVANKMSGIRAALCGDAETARGARVWNHANVLALSQRTTSEAILGEILDAWFGTDYSDDEWNRTQIDRVRAMDASKS